MTNSLLLQVTSKCSASCFHCPFTSSGECRHLSDIISEVATSKSPIIIVSGGEPFEHININSVIDLLEKKRGSLFRIATGGHISLSSYIAKLNELDQFSGISLGTDVIFKSRNRFEEFSKQWSVNLDTLSESSTPFSLTVTLGRDLIEDDFDNLFKLCKEKKPDFLLIQNSECKPLSELEFIDRATNISKQFPNVSVKYENYY